MFLKKKPRTDSGKDTSETRRWPVHHVANFSYPRTDFIHLYREEQPSARDSQGSQSSAPPLVEDHGSDMSAAEDDPQLSAANVKMWKNWHAKEKTMEGAERGAVTNSTGHQQQPANPPGSSPTTRCPPSSGSQSGQKDRGVVVPRPEQQGPHAPKPPPRASYSLFPSPSVCKKRVAPAPLQTPTVLQQAGLAPSPVSPSFPTPASSRGGVTDWINHPTATSRPGVSTTKAPGPVYCGSIAASSSDSVPLLLRSPGPTPPRSPPSTSSSSEGPRWSFEPEPRKSPPPETTPRDFSLAKKTTRSSPSLANLARAQRQGETLEPLPPKPPTPTGIHNRPLPPLPTDRLPSSPPPNVSVFEIDTDGEDETGNVRPSSGETKNFARRFMHGLVHHHSSYHDRLDQGQGQLADHKRSVSDEGPTTATRSSAAPAPAKDRGSGGSGGGTGRSGISRTLNAAARYRWGGPVSAGEDVPPRRAAVSMELPRENSSEDGARGMSQQAGEEGDKGGRFLGRLLRRKG
ncbi:hypothetical protein B0I37DRAFT_43783 [Chaetomium sp. MPI-CAGE-AT-0009]|nr:hypothetical protein B0I37DRAFT_43783 [Chaetomium sp. MPI-CAGE-AT-0009]